MPFHNRLPQTQTAVADQTVVRLGELMLDMPEDTTPQELSALLPFMQAYRRSFELDGSYAQPDVSGVAPGDIEQPSEQAIYPTPKKSIGSRALDVAEFLTAPVTTEGYNPIRSMRESETVLQGLGHLPGALITLGASGFGMKKVVGATGRKVGGEIATRTIDPTTADFYSQIGDIAKQVKTNPKLYLSKYHKLYEKMRGMWKTGLASHGVPSEQISRSLAARDVSDFAFRKAFGLSPTKRASKLVSRTGKRKYKLKEDVPENLDSIEAVVEDIQSENHPIFATYHKTLTPVLTKKGKPSLQMKYYDRYDFDWNPGEFKENVDFFGKFSGDLKGRLRHLSYMAQRTAAEKLTKPLTFEGTLSGDKVWDVLKTKQRFVRESGTSRPHETILNYITGRHGSGGKFTKKPDKGWLQAMQDYYNASLLTKGTGRPADLKYWGRSGIGDWNRALKELGYGVTPSGAVIKWGKDAQRIYKKRFNISDAKESLRKSYAHQYPVGINIIDK